MSDPDEVSADVAQCEPPRTSAIDLCDNQELLDLIDKRNEVFDKRNILEAAVQQLNDEIDAFDRQIERQIEFTEAARIAADESH